MKRDPQFERPVPRPDVAVEPGVNRTTEEASFGELLKRLTKDTGQLIQQEVALAKAEMREAGTTIARDSAKVGVGLGVALAGALALTAGIVVVLGDALDNYWLAALIVGIAFTAIGAMLARNAINDVKQRGIAPKETIQSLREDKQWAGEVAQELKRDVTNDPARTSTR